MKFNSPSSIYICILILSILSLSISILAAPTSDIPRPNSGTKPPHWQDIEKSANGTAFEDLPLESPAYQTRIITRKTVGPILRGEVNGVVFRVGGGWFKPGWGLEAKRFSVKAQVENIEGIVKEINGLKAAKKLVDYGWSRYTGRIWVIYGKKPVKELQTIPEE